jgi:mannose/fructose/sorbose-specific phosphotransferase system IIA component
LIVVTHGDLACALVRTAELIAGSQAGISCLMLAPGESVESLQSRMEMVLGADQPALLLVDMPGGTPWNVALRLTVGRQDVRVVSGVNLSMLLEAALSRSAMNVNQLAQLAQEVGAQAVRIADNR